MRKKVQQEQGQDVSLLSRAMATLVTEGAAHQKVCDAMAKDVDAIGKSMGMLTAILTMKRRNSGDDSNGEK
jgi:predicted transcriptional regulator